MINFRMIYNGVYLNNFLAKCFFERVTHLHFFFEQIHILISLGNSLIGRPEKCGHKSFEMWPLQSKLFLGSNQKFTQSIFIQFYCENQLKQQKKLCCWNQFVCSQERILSFLVILEICFVESCKKGIRIL